MWLPFCDGPYVIYCNPPLSASISLLLVLLLILLLLEPYVNASVITPLGCWLRYKLLWLLQ